MARKFGDFMKSPMEIATTWNDWKYDFTK